MNLSTPKITPFLWFDSQAEEAATFYTSIFADGRITDISRFNSEGGDIHGQADGSVMSVSFEIGGQHFVALNGGPYFEFNPAVSFQISCDSQDEVDYYWSKLGQDGDVGAQQCGWLKDRFGLSWQVVPAVLHEMLTDPDREKAERVTKAMLQMKKLDIEALQQAYAG